MAPDRWAYNSLSLCWLNIVLFKLQARDTGWRERRKLNETIEESSHETVHGKLDCQRA